MLEIYFPDMEGGASTLIVSPSGQSVLVDTGSLEPPHRDATRILEPPARQLHGVGSTQRCHRAAEHGVGEKEVPQQQHVDFDVEEAKRDGAVAAGRESQWHRA